MLETSEELTTKYSMVYMENEACPEKNDFLWDKGQSAINYTL